MMRGFANMSTLMAWCFAPRNNIKSSKNRRSRQLRKGFAAKVASGSGVAQPLRHRHSEAERKPGLPGSDQRCSKLEVPVQAAYDALG